MRFSVQADARDTLRALDRLGRQAKYATAEGINRTLKDLQRETRAQARKGLTVRRGTWADKSHKISKFARKGDAGGPWGELRIQTPGDPSRSNILTQHEEGGRKRPKQGSRVGVPVGARRGKAGLINKADRIRELDLRPASISSRLKKGRGGATQRTRRTQLIGKRNTFMVKSPKGVFILQRKGRGKRSGLHLLWSLERSVPLKRRLGFLDTARQVVPKRLPANLREAMQHAIQTAR